MNQIQTSFPAIQIKVSQLSFNDALIEAVDQTFLKLGLEIKQKLYSILETYFKLCKQDMPSRIADFVSAVERIFGTSVSLIEIDIMKSLHRKVPQFKYVQANLDFDFCEYLKDLKIFMISL
jgi:hypothetical protein